MLFSLPQVSEIVNEVLSPELLSLADVSGRLGVPLKQIQEWARDGLLPARKVAGRWIVSLSALALWQLRGMECLNAQADTPPELVSHSIN